MPQLKLLTGLFTSPNEPPVPTFEGAKLHNPVPVTGTVPLSVATVPHTVWLPADTETVGLCLISITTSSMLGVQTPLLIVQRKVYVCPAVPVNVLAFERVLLKAVKANPSGLPPGAKLQTPVPDPATFPDNVTGTLVSQTF